jgi:hypothetical protein
MDRSCYYHAHDTVTSYAEAQEVVCATRAWPNSTRAAIAHAVSTAKPCCVKSGIALYFVQAAWRQEGS